MSKTSKKKIFAVIVAAIVALAVLFSVVVTVVALKYKDIYVFIEKNGILCMPIEVNKTLPHGMVELSLTDLKNDARVTFDQSLMLVNTEYRLPDGFEAQVSEYKDTDVYMNDSMIESYAQLSAYISRRFREKLYVSSDFRSQEEQEALYAEDPKTATLPGASEHQAGLALDVYVAYYSGDGFIGSPEGRYVNSNSWRYGFIIRYPSYAEEITGIRYEPWHIRYVGRPHSDVIYRNHTTLEEYISSLEIGVWYEVDGYLICRQEMTDDGKLSVPQKFEHATVSPDNTGCYIITVEQ